VVADDESVPDVSWLYQTRYVAYMTAMGAARLYFKVAFRAIAIDVGYSSDNPLEDLLHHPEGIALF
jgi:hypothetical protein